MTPNELMNLFYLARIIGWRHELELLDAEAVAELIKVLKAANNQLRERIASELPSVWANYTPDKGGIAMRLWLGEILNDPAAQIESTITEGWSISAQQSLAAYNDILSFGGIAKNIATVPITLEAVRGLASKKLFAGWSLPELVGKAFSEGQIASVIESLDKSLANGWGYKKAVKDVLDTAIDQGFQVTQRQAITLARSYIQQASVNAQLAVYERNKDVVKGVKWCAILDNRVCELCSALDSYTYVWGEERPPMPRHPRCLLPDTFVVAPDRIAAFISTYSGPVFEFILSSGARFTVTANHMFLTNQGFSPAYALRKGDNVFYSPRHSIRAKSAIIPNDNWKPSRIYDIVETLSKTAGMTTVRMPLSAKDLHGDGKFGNGYVDIILPDCLLGNNIDSSFFESVCKNSFGLTDIREFPFLSKSDSIDERFWLWLSSGCHMSGLSVAEVFFSGSSRHHKAVSGGIIPDLDAIQIENAPYNNSASFEAFCNRIFRFSGKISSDNFIFGQSIAGITTFNSISSKKSCNSLVGTSINLSDFRNRFKGIVTLDNIISVKEKFFSGHVYDLQTLTSLYYIDGVIASNCRCLWLPWVKSWRDLGIDADDLEKAARPWLIREKGNIDAGGNRKVLNFGTTKEDFPGWWKTLDYKDQIQSIGPIRTKLINEGKLSWKDLVNKNTGHFYTLKELGFTEGGKKIAKSITFGSNEEFVKYAKPVIEPYLKNNGFKEIVFETSKKNYLMATNGKGIFYLSGGEQPSLDNINLAKDFKNTWAKAASGEALSRTEEQSIEFFWHEIIHNRQLGGTRTSGTKSDMIMELTTEWTARRTYPQFLEKIGTKASHQKEIEKEGIGYHSRIKNFDFLCSKLGIDNQKDMLNFMNNMIENEDVKKYPKKLLDYLFQNSKIKINKKDLNKALGLIEYKNFEFALKWEKIKLE